MKSRLDIEMMKLEKLVEKKQDQIEKQNYEKYHKLYEDTMEYLKGKKVLLYGGLAINELMPSNLKIYKPFTLPDIDIFSATPVSLAKGIVKHLTKKGYSLVSTAKALHEGTYKVYAHGLQVVDITEVSPYAFKVLGENSTKTSSGVAISNVNFLRLSLHTMMSQSNDAHRWPKVFERLVRFYEVFPPQLCKGNAKSVPDKIPKEIVDAAYEWFDNKPYVHWGAREIHAILEKATPYTDTIPQIQVMVEKPEEVETIASLKTFMESRGVPVQLSKTFPGDDFSPPHRLLLYKKRPLACFYLSDACLTYNELGNGPRVASIHTMLRMILSIHLSSYPHLHKLRDSLVCIGNMLSMKQQNITGSKKKIHQQFILNCYGYQAGMVTMRRNMMLKKFVGHQ